MDSIIFPHKNSLPLPQSEQDVELLREVCLDYHRESRTGVEEVVLAGKKTDEQLRAITKLFLEQRGRVLLTKLSHEQQSMLSAEFAELQTCPRSGVAWVKPKRSGEESCLGSVAVVSGGTSDGDIVAEAARTLEYFGVDVQEISDIGVGGLHRLLGRIDEIKRHDLIIAVAGMEAALPSVLCGLVRQPIIAVPTSVGYGVSLGGLTALASLLASCSPGMSVVNIDNGFGAAVSAYKMLSSARQKYSATQGL